MSYQWTVKELREMLEGEPDDAIVFAIWHDESNQFHERPIYKSSTAANKSEHYLYLGNER
ncbi:hypothetical protein SAMN03080615_01613 [Amphritea atlantica]|uniref:Uncharacterized protein n=1 Tax=Amphritea atlantica TaxID=355243 RepID=A0A1H9GCY6_9GAMM|nr:hypothetical protein SAMN03080615_01613 [Amphritea atlantica]